jgi:hypothetical protein
MSQSGRRRYKNGKSKLCNRVPRMAGALVGAPVNGTALRLAAGKSPADDLRFADQRIASTHEKCPRGRRKAIETRASARALAANRRHQFEETRISCAAPSPTCGRWAAASPRSMR